MTSLTLVDNTLTSLNFIFDEDSKSYTHQIQHFIHPNLKIPPNIVKFIWDTELDIGIVDVNYGESYSEIEDFSAFVQTLLGMVNLPPTFSYN